MFVRLLGFLRRPSVTIHGADALPDGQAEQYSFAEPPPDGIDILLCRREGKLFALDALCPHEGGRLIGGPLIDGRYVTCPLHKYKFDPANGRAVGVACKRARTFRVALRGADCEVFL